MHGRFLNTSLLFSFWRCCDHWRKLPKWNMALLRLALWTHTERKKNFFLTARLGHFFSLASVETGLLFFLAQWELAFELESNSVDNVDCCRKWLVNFIPWKLSFFHLTDLITLPLLNLSHLTEPLTERLLRWKWMGLLLKKILFEDVRLSFCSKLDWTFTWSLLSKVSPRFELFYDYFFSSNIHLFLYRYTALDMIYKIM